MGVLILVCISRDTDKIAVKGQDGAQADAPAAGQKASGEAEEDSDDDQEEGEGAPEAGVAGGASKSSSIMPFTTPLLDPA